MSFTAKSRKIVSTFFVLLLVALVVFRLYLPQVVTNYLNKTLANLDGYRGHVETVDIHLWRCAYSIINLKIQKIEGHIPVPFVQIDGIDFSFAWKPIFRGNLSGKVELNHPVINFVSGGPNTEHQTTVKSQTWQDSAKKMFPLRIARLGVKDGELHFRNFHSDPPVDVYVDSITLIATNLTNSKRLSRTLKATVDVSALAMHSGLVKAHIDLDPLDPSPTFSTAFKIEQLQLPELNSFFQHYLAVQAKSGVLDFYMEGRADHGKFSGYIKPLFQKLDLLKMKEDPSIGEFFKAIAVKFVSYTFKNHKEDQLGTEVDISGTVDNPDVDVWSAVVNFFHNWFVQALYKGFDSHHHDKP